MEELSVREAMQRPFVGQTSISTSDCAKLAGNLAELERAYEIIPNFTPRAVSFVTYFRSPKCQYKILSGRFMTQRGIDSTPSQLHHRMLVKGALVIMFKETDGSALYFLQVYYCDKIWRPQVLQPSSRIGVRRINFEYCNPDTISVYPYPPGIRRFNSFLVALLSTMGVQTLRASSVQHRIMIQDVLYSV